MIKRLLLIAIILGMAVAAQAQKRIIVYDKETKVPVPKARVRVDRMRTFSTDYQGRFVAPARYDTLEIICPKYLTCKMAATAVGDSIGLIPSSHNLNEVVVYGEDLAKKLNRNLTNWTQQDPVETALKNAQSGVSLDVTKLLDFKTRARNKRMKKVGAALDQLAKDSDDPIEQAYIDAMRKRQQPE